MQKDPTEISEELRRKAEVCETISEDKTEESLTGASAEKGMNEEEAKAWRLKSQVWREAEAMVRKDATGQPPAAK